MASAWQPVERQLARIDRHADHCVDSLGVQAVDLFAGGDPAGSRDTALATVLKHRDYCCHGAAYTPDDLRQLADDCETQPADFFEEVP